MLRRAFTLIELLLVVAIIALLAALMYPAYRSARASVARAQCMTSLKQIGFATQIYCDEYDSTYPPGAYGLNGPPNGWTISWHDLLLPKLESPKLFVCPEGPSNASLRTCYGVNRFISGYFCALRQSQVLAPSLSPYVSEKENLDFCAYGLDEQKEKNWSPLSTRHGAKVLVLYADGHVETRKREEVTFR